MSVHKFNLIGALVTLVDRRTGFSTILGTTVSRGGIRFAAGDSGTRTGAESLVVADVRGVTYISLSVDVKLTEAVAAVEAVLPGVVAVQHQLTRSRQAVSLGDDPGVVSTDVRRSGEP